VSRTCEYWIDVQRFIVTEVWPFRIGGAKLEPTERTERLGRGVTHVVSLRAELLYPMQKCPLPDQASSLRL
jgi:hypothetical protein